jgi:hypothetical protein
MKIQNMELLTAKEVRKILKVSPKVLTNILKGDNPPPTLKIGREYRFYRFDFFEWLKSQMITQGNESEIE